MVSNEARHALIIPKLILEHSGQYVCHAINSYGSIETAAKLKVYIHKSTSQPDSIFGKAKPAASVLQETASDGSLNL